MAMIYIVPGLHRRHPMQARAMFAILNPGRVGRTS
jgi:hypothetical protein